MTQATAYTFDEDCFSDLHKDAYGYRPRGDFFEWLQTASDDQKQAMWDDLLQALERTVAQEKAEQAEAVARFEATVAIAIASGAKDRATAIRWLKDAEGDQCVADEEYFEWLKGIPYGYIKKTQG